jgi:DUF3048 family protein
VIGNARIADLYSGPTEGYFRDIGRAARTTARSTGSGDAPVLRDGKAFQARWSPPSADGGTALTNVSGQPMTFAPDPVWIVLAAW